MEGGYWLKFGNSVSGLPSDYRRQPSRYFVDQKPRAVQDGRKTNLKEKPQKIYFCGNPK